MNQSKQVTDGALLLAVFVILLLFTMFVPVISFAGFFLIPVPFILYAARYNWQPSLIMFGAAILLSLLFVPAISLPLSVYAGIGGLMIGLSIYQRLSPYETWARGTMGFVFGLLFIYLFMQYVLNINLGQELSSIMEDSLKTSMGLLENVGLEQEQIKEVHDLMEENFANLMKLIPVMLVVIGMIIGLLAQWISYKIWNRLEKKKLYFPPFRSFKLPVVILAFYIIALLVVWFSNHPDNTIAMAANNVYALIGVLLSIQGIAFLFFYAHAQKRSKALPITVLVLTLLFPMVLFYFVKIIGIIDIGFDLRKKLTQNKK